jgi:hypothetical protein
VIGHNLHTRHLTDNQRAAVAAKLANILSGSNQYQRVSSGVAITTLPLGDVPAVSVEEAAEVMNVSVSSVNNAKIVLTEGTPEQIRAVDMTDRAFATDRRCCHGQAHQ